MNKRRKRADPIDDLDLDEVFNEDQKRQLLNLKRQKTENGDADEAPE